ncbi:MAG: beta-ketoacyl-[acyl-carrier-protein] synthase family protein [bacterium]
MEREVVITGIGLITALGSREDTWRSVKSGRSGVRKFNLDNFEFTGACINRNIQKVFNLSDLIKTAIDESLIDSNINHANNKNRSICSTLSVSKPDFSSYSRSGNFLELFNSYSVKSSLQELGFVSQVYEISAACATGIYSAIKAYKLIKNGEVDICIAGAGEMPFNALYYSGFNNMGVLAQDGEPREMMKPFDRNRNGFVLGEGACVVIFEELESAVARGASIYCKVAGGISAFDPKGFLKFEKDSLFLTKALLGIVKDGGMDIGKNTYVHSHGTATAVNDIMETNSLKRAFNKEAYKLKISSTKPMTGHLLGVSGILGVAFSSLALRDQFVPPTINLSETDPECDLNYTALKGQKVKIENTIAVSMGFGGHIGTMGLSRV